MGGLDAGHPADVRLANAVEEFADDSEKAERYGAASLDRANNEFDHRRVVGEYLKMYDDLWNMS